MIKRIIQSIKKNLSMFLLTTKNENEITTQINKKNIENIILRNLSYVDRYKYKKYRKEYADISKNLKKTNYPIQIDFELNYSCNFRCPMCTWSAENTAGKGKSTWFDFEVFKEVIDISVKKGLKCVRFNYINEPLIRKDIVKFIKYAKKRGIIDTYFSTNGSLLTEKISKEIINSGLDRLQISIDANTKETYDKIRLGGEFSKTIQNVKNFIQLRNSMGKELPTVRVNFVKTKTNKHELEDFINYWKDKVDGIGIQDLVGITEDYGKETSISKKTNKRFKCAQPFVHLSVRYDGTVLPCCSFYGAEIPVGILKTSKDVTYSSVENIGLVDKSKKAKLITGTIQEIWNGNEMKFYREIHSKNEYYKDDVCNKCVNSMSHLDETL
jgi:MoaA/NifB/PqqE/SkfB family radical SAM enzyme